VKVVGEVLRVLAIVLGVNKLYATAVCMVLGDLLVASVVASVGE
jgi:hypothetical protein